MLSKKEFINTFRAILAEMGYETEEISEPSKGCCGIASKAGKSRGVHPVINMDHAYEMYKNGADITLMAKEAAGIFRQHESGKIGIPQELVDNILSSYDELKKHLIIKVFDVERKKDMLKDVVYEQVENLAIVPYILFDISPEGNLAVSAVMKTLIQHFGVSEEDVIRDAKKSSAELMPMVAANADDMIQMLVEMAKIDIPEPFRKTPVKMFFVTNTMRMNGASALFYDGVMKQLEKTMGGSYFIIPSSIHEFIIMPVYDSGLTAEDVLKMVKEVNASPEVIKEEDILGNSVYCYCSGLFQRVA